RGAVPTARAVGSRCGGGWSTRRSSPDRTGGQAAPLKNSIRPPPSGFFPPRDGREIGKPEAEKAAERYSERSGGSENSSARAGSLPHQGRRALHPDSTKGSKECRPTRSDDSGGASPPPSAPPPP